MTQDTSPDHPATQRPQFDVALRGYERSQVDEHIGRLHQETGQLTAGLRQERDLALNRAQQAAIERDSVMEKLQALQNEVNRLRAEPPTVEQPLQRDQVSLFGDRLQTILATAEQEASAVKSEAADAAARLRTEAADEAERTRSDADREAQTLLGQARSEAERTLTAAREESTATLTAARQEAETTVTEADARARNTVDTADALAKKTVTDARAEAESTLAAARAEAETTVTQARELAATVTAEATAQAEQITTTAENSATATVEAARREEAAVRDNLAELVRQRDRVRAELTDISAVIEKLLGPIQAANIVDAAVDAVEAEQTEQTEQAEQTGRTTDDSGDTTAIAIPGLAQNRAQHGPQNSRTQNPRPSPQPR
jgi:cell division septum initiation protein DivIVA